MNSNEIKYTALNSATEYFNYCEEEAGARAVIPVKEIENENSFYIFTLLKDMTYGTDKEKYDVRINDKVLNKRDYNFLKYDDENKRLFISFNIKFEFTLTPENTQIESNLLFLVENVKKWYENAEHSVTLTTKLPDVPSFPASKKYTPSKEQLEAVNITKNNKLSYVWGAPGTGKTQFVLARCIADYIQKFKEKNPKHKIIVSAPTNNSLEQILFGVFKVLEEEHIPTDTVIRLGMPSKKFASQYPNSCERLSVENRVSKLKKQIDELKTIQIKRKENNEISNFNTIFSKFSSELNTIKDQKEQLEERIIEIQNDTDTLQLELSEIRIEIYESELKHREAQKSARKVFNRIIKSNKHTSQYEVDVLNVKIHKLKDSETLKDAELLALNAELENTQKQLRDLKTPEDIKREVFLFLKKHNRSESSAIQNLLSYLKMNIQNSTDDFLDLAIKNCQQVIERNTIIIDSSQFSGLNDEEISNKITELTAEYEELKKDGTKAQISNANVIALTVDRFILEYELLNEMKDDKKYGIEHIFIDEAAYLSMIKGLTLLSLERPTTLLGDHMQLPPVFECKESVIKKKPYLSLWEIPIIYVEELFENDFNTFYKNYRENVSPAFKNLVKANLNITYRFGKKLANILRGTVYSQAFHSANDKNPTDITIINAVKIPTTEKRVSPLEVEAIRDYLNLFSHNLTTFSVLTPYKKQLKELNKALPKDVNAITIHASQGQEWDTVIISTVDKFMARDVRLINTAVSRAKKHLIVVCDAEEWKMHEKYLMSKIVSHSDKTINYQNIDSFKE